MTTLQNAIEYAMDQMTLGKITADEANVMVVQMAGMLVVKNKIPMQVRKALNKAVKNGELGKLKKDGLKPEIYHHKNGRANALTEQKRIANESIEILSKICK